MNICVLGHTGFVGQTVYNYLSDNHQVCGINSKTKFIPTEEFDIVINCAGNAKKYLAHKNPSKDFHINTNVFNTLLQMNIKKLIHISSIESTFSPDNNYAVSKYIIEKCCKLYFPKSIILRLGGIIGPNLKKNVIYDIINNKKLFVTFDSTYNYISTQEVAKIIEKIIDSDIENKTLNIASSKSISVKEIIEEAKNNHIFFNKSEGEIEENYTRIDTSELNKFFTVKKSIDYIKEYFNKSK